MEWSPGRRVAIVTEVFTVDSTELPDVTLAAPGTSWDQITRYLGVAQRPVLAELPDEAGTYVGGYWDAAGSRANSTYPVTFGPTQADALVQFRGYLRGMSVTPAG
jgi:hypothetical protein